MENLAGPVVLILAVILSGLILFLGIRRSRNDDGPFDAELITRYAQARGGQEQVMASGRPAALFTRPYGRLLAGYWLEPAVGSNRRAPHVHLRAQLTPAPAAPDVLVQTRRSVSAAVSGYTAFRADDPALDDALFLFHASATEEAEARAFVSYLSGWLQRQHALTPALSMRYSGGVFTLSYRCTIADLDALDALVAEADAGMALIRAYPAVGTSHRDDPTI